MKPTDDDIAQCLEDWQWWVMEGSYRLHALGLSDSEMPSGWRDIWTRSRKGIPTAGP